MACYATSRSRILLFFSETIGRKNDVLPKEIVQMDAGIVWINSFIAILQCPLPSSPEYSKLPQHGLLTHA